MEHVGMRGKILEIMKSYIRDRTSYTKIAGVMSTKLPCDDGVPQGSILGPILFLIYINDIVHNIPKENILIFADDLFLIESHYKYEIMMENLQDHFNKICQWCEQNEVFISEEKTVLLEIKTPHVKTTHSMAYI